MYLEILKILFYSYKERKVADERFVRKIATIIIEYKKLGGYIKEIKFLPKSPMFTEYNYAEWDITQSQNL